MKTDQAKKRGAVPLEKILIFTIIALILGIAGYFGYRFIKNRNSEEQESQYKAVFLTSGQVYFGKLKSEDEKYVYLENVYFLTKKKIEDDELESTESAQPQYSLNPLVAEPRGPTDELQINRENILTMETLRENSQITQIIMKNSPSQDLEDGAGLIEESTQK